MTMAYRILIRSFFPTGLLKDTIQCARRQVVAEFTGKGHASWFGGVFELPVAAYRRDEIPTIISQFVHDLANFHGASIA